jgi:pimeloyl-ACP methyl ester carboxylesterase
VLAVADRFGLDRFDLVGHDWGAMVAWVVAGRHPERLRTLTAVSVPHPRAFAAAFGTGGGADGGADGDGAGPGDEDQRQRSSYIEVFRAEGGVAERALLGEDGSGSGLRAMFDASGLSSDSDEVRAFVATMLEPGAMTAALNWYRATEPNSLTDVGQITVPTLYVWSDNDIALGRSAAEATVRWVSGPYRFEVLEGVSHWIPETAPDALNRLLLGHLAAHG